VKTIKRKILTFMVILILVLSIAVIHENVKIAHATVTSITLTSPANNTHSMDTTPDFTFTAISDNETSITCDVFVNGVASGNITATNNTETTITCNQTLTVSGDPYEWYINGTDQEGTTKSAVRNIYVVPSTGPIDIPDGYDKEDKEVQTRPSITSKEIVGVIALCAFLAVLAVISGGKRGILKSASRHSKR